MTKKRVVAGARRPTLYSEKGMRLGDARIVAVVMGASLFTWFAATRDDARDRIQADSAREHIRADFVRTPASAPRGGPAVGAPASLDREAPRPRRVDAVQFSDVANPLEANELRAQHVDVSLRAPLDRHDPWTLEAYDEPQAIAVRPRLRLDRANPWTGFGSF